MKTAMMPFQYQEKPVRVVMQEENPWWVAKDVCDVLTISNHKDALSRLDDDEKDEVGITDPIGRIQQTNVINESGLYHLIFQSRKAEANVFRKWVTNEVLPQIRQTGKYEMSQPTDDVIDEELHLPGEYRNGMYYTPQHIIFADTKEDWLDSAWKTNAQLERQIKVMMEHIDLLKDKVRRLERELTLAKES